jgi:hypothetical protein
MTLDGRMFFFSRAATLRQILEMIPKGIKESKGLRNEDRTK